MKKIKPTSITLAPVAADVLDAAPATCNLHIKSSMKVKTGIKAGGGACFGK